MSDSENIHVVRLAEVRPRAEFLNAIPVLPSLDIAETIAFYEAKLGFQCEFQQDEYAGLGRGNIQIHLWKCDDPEIPGNTSCRINVKGIDELFEEYRAHDVIHPNGSIASKPWGFREFAVVDSNGNLLIFAEDLQVA